MIAAIPYTTFPDIDLGPLTLRTFGTMVALGVVLGTIVAARWGERWGVPADETVSMATWMVVAGIVGARITWVLTHLSQIDSPVDVIAVWEGGLQFSGGFIAAIAVGMPRFRRWSRETRWRLLDGYALGLTLGLAVGRIGCYSVGEHLGDETGFFLASRYDGGPTREGHGVDGPLLEVGDVIHNTSLYELMHLLVLAGFLWWLMARRRAAPGTAIGVFVLWYGVARLGTDFLRAYDDTVLGLTGAQWLCVVLIPTGLVLLRRSRQGRRAGTTDGSPLVT